MPTKIFAGNLPDGTSIKQITEFFSVHGKVADANVIRNYAFVHFEDEEEAKKATKASRTIQTMRTIHKLNPSILVHFQGVSPTSASFTRNIAPLHVPSQPSFIPQPHAHTKERKRLAHPTIIRALPNKSWRPPKIFLSVMAKNLEDSAVA